MSKFKVFLSTQIEGWVRSSFCYIEYDYISKFFNYKDLYLTSKKMLHRVTREKKNLSKNRIIYDKMQ